MIFLISGFLKATSSLDSITSTFSIQKINRFYENINTQVQFGTLFIAEE